MADFIRAVVSYVQTAPPVTGSWGTSDITVDPAGNAYLCIQGGAGTAAVWIQIAGSGGLNTPNIIFDGDSFIIPDNEQVTYSSVIYVEAGGVIGTIGDGVLSWVN